MKIKSLRLLYLVMFLPVFIFNIPAANAAPACGSGKNAYLLSVGSPVGSRQFAVACIEHDACYDIFGKSQGECDKAFHNRMLGICSRDHNTLFGRPLKIACNGRADAFYSAVNRLGKSAYDKAQTASAPAPVPQGEMQIEHNSGFGEWTKMPGGNAKDISVGADGTVWALNGDGTIWKWNGDDWTKMPGGNALKVAVGGNDLIWALNRDGTIWKWNDNDWTKMPGGNAKDISVGADGTVWALNGDGTIWKWNSDDWTKMPSGKVRRITVGGNNSIWVLSLDGTIWKRK
jgi:Tectonin domain/Group XII secretory phospholipase A2 precursor (PLA2G12)